jgi:hypothetical protein
MRQNTPANYETRNWSETRWLGTWNPDEGVGFYLHAGRFRHDVDLWWAQSVVYLPEGKLAVDRSWGRQRAEDGVRTGVFELLVPEPNRRVTSRFDGAMTVVTPEDLAAAPRGAGGFSVPIRFEVEAEAIRPHWDIYAGLDQKQDWADGGHLEQHHRVSGEITVDGTSVSLDGWGFDDHSHGVRSWDGFGGHIFFNVPFEDFGLHVIAIQGMDGTPSQLIAVHMSNGEDPDPVTELATPLAGDLLGAPHRFRSSLKTASGRELDLEIEVLHTFPMTMTEEHNDNINGLDWDVPGNPLLFTECIARYETGDGQVGYGHLERSARRERVSRDTLAVTDPWELTR